MYKLARVAAAAAFVVTSTSASAWWGWGGPVNGLGDGVGNGAMDFNVGFSGRTNSHLNGRGYGYNQPYYGQYPYAGYPVAAVGAEEQAKLIEAQRKAAEQFAAQQAEAYRQAVETQRKAIEAGCAQQLPEAMPASSQGRPQFVGGFRSHDEIVRQMEARRVEFRKEIEARRMEREEALKARRAEMDARFKQL